MAVDKVTVWEDPPNLKVIVYGLLVLTCMCSVSLLSQGFLALHNPSAVISSDILKIPGAMDDPIVACTVDGDKQLCPRIDEKFKLTEEHLLPWFETIGRWIMWTNIFNLVCAIILFLISLKMKKGIMGCALLTVPISVILDAMLINVINYPDNPMNHAGIIDLRHRFQRKYVLNPSSPAEHPFTLIFNTIMIQHKCCGIYQSNDTLVPTDRNTITGKDGQEMLFELPPACCAESDKPLLSISNGVCISEIESYPPYSEGCFHAVYRKIKDIHGNTYMIILVVQLICHSLLFTAVVLVMFQRKKGELVYKGRVLPDPDSSKTNLTAPQSISRVFIKRDENNAIEVTQMKPQSNIDRGDGTAIN